MSEDDLCPIEMTLSVIGKKWTILILRELLKGPKRFCELSSVLPISTRLLTERLREMEGKGIVSKCAYSESPPRVEYELTPHGKTLECVLRTMRDWGRAHLTVNSEGQVNPCSSQQ